MGVGVRTCPWVLASPHMHLSPSQREPLLYSCSRLANAGTEGKPKSTARGELAPHVARVSPAYPALPSIRKLSSDTRYHISLL